MLHSWYHPKRRMKINNPKTKTGDRIMIDAVNRKESVFPESGPFPWPCQSPLTLTNSSPAHLHNSYSLGCPQTVGRHHGHGNTRHQHAPRNTRWKHWKQHRTSSLHQNVSFAALSPCLIFSLSRLSTFPVCPWWRRKSAHLHNHCILLGTTHYLGRCLRFTRLDLRDSSST